MKRTVMVGLVANLVTGCGTPDPEVITQVVYVTSEAGPAPVDAPAAEAAVPTGSFHERCNPHGGDIGEQQAECIGLVNQAKKAGFIVDPNGGLVVECLPDALGDHYCAFKCDSAAVSNYSTPRAFCVALGGQCNLVTLSCL